VPRTLDKAGVSSSVCRSAQPLLWDWIMSSHIDEVTASANACYQDSFLCVIIFFCL
jgi:hypothetical protein